MKKKILKEFEERFTVNFGKRGNGKDFICVRTLDFEEDLKPFLSKALDTIEKETKEEMAKTMIEDFRQRLKASRNIVKNESGNEVIAGTRITLKEINSWINETLDS